MVKYFIKASLATNIQFLLESENYFNYYISLIDNAKSTVHLQTYIFDMDVFGKKVHNALINAAKRGVKVYLLIDSVGSMSFEKKDELNLILNNVLVFRFNPLNLKWFYKGGRRLHHKVLLVDSEEALIGGINVTTSGYGMYRSNQQLDFAVSLVGPVILEIEQYCQFIFSKSYRQGFKFTKNETYTSKNLVDLKKHSIQNNNKVLNNHKILSHQLINLKISINDWVYKRWQITKSYEFITQTAKSDITIINSYFFPRKKFMRQLSQAVNRGVRVRLVLPMISDWQSYVLATQYLYTYFLKNGVEIYQWKKSILHGKLATVDGRFMTIGSFNLNYTSYQQNLEMNVDISSVEFTENVNSIINELIKTGCERIDEKNFSYQSNMRLRFIRFICYIILSMIASFSVSIIRQQKK